MAVSDRSIRNPLVVKLSQFAPLSDEDVGLLEALCLPEERFRAGANIVAEGEAPRSAFVITRGMACRYRLMPDGRRQILTILIPGDFFDLHGFLLQATDHSVATIGPTRIAAIGREAVIDIIANTPGSAPPSGGARCRRTPCCGSALSRSDAAPHAGVSPISCASSFGGSGRSASPRITRPNAPSSWSRRLPLPKFR